MKRATFASNIGIILATAGSAVGLGNIWRFPYMLGANGGAAFLLVYIVCILIMGLPVMLSEFYIGRRSHSNVKGAFTKLAPGTKWNLFGFIGVSCAVMILGFYSVVAGWTLEYIMQAFSGSLAGKSAAEFTSEFDLFSTSLVRPLIWTVVFILLTHFIIASGVQKGIERASKVMMPMLFIILIALCIRSVTLEGARSGLAFLFHPDFSKVDSSSFLSAMGQAFFSLSIGMGTMITYSSYFTPKTKLQNTAVQVTVIDTIIAILAGIMIFPAAFTFGIRPEAGPQLVFITLPNVFERLPLGNVWSCVFFILLALAALTSTISMHEVATAYMEEEHKMSRKKGAWIVTGICIVLGILSSLSMGLLSGYTIGGLNFFNLLDFVTAKILLPAGGMLICIFIGRFVKRKDLLEEMTNQGTVRFYLFNTFYFLVRYVAPIAIALIFLNELGLLKKFIG